MPRASAMGHDGEGRVVGHEFGGNRFKFVDEDFVQAQITGEHKTIIGRGSDEMRVRAGLALRVHARTDVLNGGGRRPEAAVGADGQGGDAAGAVVGYESAVAGGIHRDVTGAGAARGLLVEQRELAGLSIKGVGADCASALTLSIVHFANRVKEASRWVHCEEAGIPGLGGKLRLSQLAGHSFKSGEVDPLALRTRVGTKVNVEFFTPSGARTAQQTKTGQGQVFHGLQGA